MAEPKMTEFTFNVSVSSDDLESVKPFGFFRLPEEYVTIVKGLAFIWKMSIYPNGIRFKTREDPEGVFLAIDLQNQAAFTIDAAIKPELKGTFIATNMGYTQQDIKGKPCQFLPVGPAMLLVPNTGVVQALIRLSLEIPDLTNFLPNACLSKPSPDAISQRILTNQNDGTESDHDEWSDVSIQCSDGVVKSSRYVLAASSPYYVAAFRNNATNGLEVGKLNHDAFPESVVREFLRCICSGTVLESVKELSYNNQMHLLKLADQMESPVSADLIKQLKREITLSIGQDFQYRTADFVLDILQFADIHSLPLLRNLALADLSGRLSEIPPERLPTKDANALSLELWRELCQLNKGRQRVSLVRNHSTYDECQ